MIIVLKPSTSDEQLMKFTKMLKDSYGVKVNKWDGVQSTVLGLIGDTTKVDIEYIDAQDIVESVKRVQEPYKKANRKFHPDNTVIKINDNVTIGDGSLHIMAGPCSVECEQQIVQIAKDVKASGATLLRGGAFKPRTSPYA
ncbi:MAG: 3-deoxy-7-phosphoheptulonate synthase, partial [Ruminococcus sp.]